MWIPGMLIFWVGISAVFFRWTKDEYSSWKKVGSAAALGWLLLAGPGPAAGQTNSQAVDAGPPPAEWSVEAELGGSVFFGATEQTTVATEIGVVRESPRFQLKNDASFLYGEASEKEAGSSVNKRSWEVATNLDYRGFSWLNPYVFGSAQASLEKRIQRRYTAGSGAKLTVLDTDVSRLDFAGALLVEKTLSMEEGDEDEDEVWLARWTGQAEYRRSFSQERAVFEARVDYNPKFRQLENFTFHAVSSLAFRLTEIVRLKVSVRDNFDSGAEDRGAASNNDGQVLFSVLAAF
jgi:hypothetical protein